MTLNTRQFQRRIEDFTCEQCGQFVQGDGYRNHCPHCLYSKHVDVNPGDRAAVCGGLMKVADIELHHGKVVLLHECERCGHKRKNSLHTEDNKEVLYEIMCLRGLA